MLQDRLLDGRLKIRHLTLVIAVADQGTVIAAARSLHITQPVVTRAIHEVEAILGVELFERGPRGVTPTLFGQTFITHARAIVAQLREVAGQIDLLARGEAGRVRVGTHLAGSNFLLPTAIAKLKQERPQLTIVVREATPDLLAAALLAGDLDLTVGRLTAEPSPHLTQERLHLEPIRLVARADHEVHQMRQPDLKRLIEYPWVFPVEQTALRAELESALLREGLDIPANRVECTSMLTLRHLIMTTDSIAALPLLVMNTDGGLREIRTRLKSISRSVGVTRVTDRPLGPPALALLSHLRSTAAELTQ